MAERSSRHPGFYRLPLAERRRLAAEALGIDVDDLEAALGPSDAEDVLCADKSVENVLGTYALYRPMTPLVP